MDDVYETPAYVTHAVIPYLRRHALRVWDPANGPASKIAQALNEAGFNAIATRDNFLARTSLPDPRIDAICSNPPYGAGGRPAHQFIAHAIGLVPVVVMLLRIDFDSGKTRTSLFRELQSLRPQDRAARSHCLV